MRHLPLIHLSLCRTQVKTLTPLARSPLRRLDIRSTRVTTLLSCRRMPLEELSFFASRIRRGLDASRAIGTLVRINRRTAADFWGRRDDLIIDRPCVSSVSPVPVSRAGK